MTTGAAIVIALRILVPLLIFKKNLTGGIIAMLLDGADRQYSAGYWRRRTWAPSAPATMART